MNFKIVYHKGEEREILFTTQKTLYQWEYRNANEFRRSGRPYTRYVQFEEGGRWQQFVMIGGKLVTISELEKILARLRNEARSLQSATRSADASKRSRSE